MKNLAQTAKISDQEADEIFKEFAWSLAGMFQKPKTVSGRTAARKTRQNAKVRGRSLSANIKLSQVARSC